MKIALVKPAWLCSSPMPILGQPLGIASIAATLRKEGHEVLIFDAVLKGWANAETMDIHGQSAWRVGLADRDLASLVPDDVEMIGISTAFTHDMYTVSPLAQELRRAHERAKIVLGGVFPSTLPRKAAGMEVDYVALGEGELSMAALANGRHDVPGLYPAADVLAAMNEDDLERGVVTDLDAIPYPAREMLPFEPYMAHGASGRGKAVFGASIHTSRGCPYKCGFCSVHSVFKRGFRKRSADHVWAEMSEIMGRYGVRRFEFEDDNLTLDRARAFELFERMARWNTDSGKPISFITPNGIRMDTLDRELLRLMKRAGCKRISLAAEHGDPDMLRMMNKKLAPERVVETVKLCRSEGISMAIYFIVGYPGETEEKWRTGLRFMASLKRIDPTIYFSIHSAKALPKTDLLRLCRDRGFPVEPDPEEMFLSGHFGNITTPDFTPLVVDERSRTAERILNRPSLLRRARGFAGRVAARLVGRRA